MFGTGNDKINDTQYLISKDFVTTEKAYGAVNGNQATNTYSGSTVGKKAHEISKQL